LVPNGTGRGGRDIRPAPWGGGKKKSKLHKRGGYPSRKTKKTNHVSF